MGIDDEMRRRVEEETTAQALAENQAAARRAWEANQAEQTRRHEVYLATVQAEQRTKGVQILRGFAAIMNRAGNPGVITIKGHRCWYIDSVKAGLAESPVTLCLYVTTTGRYFATSRTDDGQAAQMVDIDLATFSVEDGVARHLAENGLQWS